MAVPNVTIQLILFATIGLAFFDAVTGLRCYSEDFGQINEMECHSDHHGCGTAQCGDETVRGCASDLDYKVLDVSILLGHLTGVECKKSYCTEDLCNNEGLEKTAVRCYGEYRGQITELECRSDLHGCGKAQCGDETVRGCAPDPDFNIIWVHSGLYIDNLNSCNRSYCSEDLCNNEGFEKTGLKCNRKDHVKDETTVQECVTGHVGCGVGWNCDGDDGDGYYYLKLECSSVNDCSNSNDDIGICCAFCDTDLCNDASLIRKITKKSTTLKNEEKSTTPEESTPKNEENSTAPPNGAAAGIVGWGQIVIIPIGFMALVLGVPTCSKC